MFKLKSLKLTLLLGLAAAFLAWPAASLAAGDITGPAPDGKVYVCHATSDTSGGVQHYDLLTISLNAAFKDNGGHFKEDGSSQSGHENDFVLLFAGQPIEAAHGASFKYGLNCESAVLAVSLRSVTAKQTAKGVTVNWRTASEIDVAGYNVYGLVHGKRVKLNSHIIASKSSGANSYAYQYRTIKGQKAPSRFWLQSINLDGSRQWHAARAAR